MISDTSQCSIPRIVITSKVLRIQKTWMDYCQNLFLLDKSYGKKSSNLSKEFILTTPASQLVERFCLGKKTEIQIFTTSCWIFTIIQIRF